VFRCLLKSTLVIVDAKFVPQVETRYLNGIFMGFFMAALCNRAGHYIFALWFLLSSFFLFFLA